jgi:hypothetical protein
MEIVNMFAFILSIFHVIGTATVLILISYLFVDLFRKKKVTVMDVLSHTLVLVILFFTLLRTG